jgi:hypothetical protein
MSNEAKSYRWIRLLERDKDNQEHVDDVLFGPLLVKIAISCRDLACLKLGSCFYA